MLWCGCSHTSKGHLWHLWLCCRNMSWWRGQDSNWMSSPCPRLAKQRLQWRWVVCAGGPCALPPSSVGLVVFICWQPFWKTKSIWKRARQMIWELGKVRRLRALNLLNLWKKRWSDLVLMHWDNFVGENFGNKRKSYNVNPSWKLKPTHSDLDTKHVFLNMSTTEDLLSPGARQIKPACSGALARTQMKL